jgi:hypothetical protein
VLHMTHASTSPFQFWLKITVIAHFFKIEIIGFVVVEVIGLIFIQAWGIAY